MFCSAMEHRNSLGRMGSSGPQFSGMTVNERLATAGLVGEWDAAIIAGDRQRAISVLLRVELDETSAAFTVDTTLANPSKYGFRRST